MLFFDYFKQDPNIDLPEITAVGDILEDWGRTLENRRDSPNLVHSSVDRACGQPLASYVIGHKAAIPSSASF